jgi:hypothetical protein
VCNTLETGTGISRPTLSRGARYDEYRSMLYAAIPKMTDKIKRCVDVAWKQCPESARERMDIKGDDSGVTLNQVIWSSAVRALQKLSEVCYLDLL